MGKRTVTDEQEATIWDLHVKRVPQTAIACQVKCNRNTVGAVIRRITAELGEERRDKLEQTRDEALAVYNSVQREAWERLNACSPTSTASAGYLSIILDARRQQDRLLGLEKLTVNHTDIYLTKIDALMNQPVVRDVLEGDYGDPSDTAS